MERALGIQWCIESDTFQFRINLLDRPLTRRGVLSTVSSIYDPLGFAAPVVLVGKQILQDLCRDQIDWDSPLPDLLRPRWERWRTDLHHLEEVRVNRCFKPNDFGEVKSAQLHHFSDASSCGYSQCSYLRLVDESQRVHCSLVMGKARVCPLRAITVPRLELTAAVLSVEVSSILTKELESENLTEIYWTDSKIVLGYISSDTKRFHVFVANRIQQIRDRCDPSQWKYVPTDLNPADEGSRGMSAKDFATKSKWISGPDFLWMYDFPETPLSKSDLSTSAEDPEVRKSFATTADVLPGQDMLQRLERLSTWHGARTAIAGCLRIKSTLRARLAQRTQHNSANDVQTGRLTVQEMCEGELEIIRMVQQTVFSEELKLLKSEDKTSGTRPAYLRSLKRNSPLYRLDPFVDESGIIRVHVGGRLIAATVPYGERHPVIVPRNHHVCTLIVRHFHEKVAHQGRGFTVNEIRANGFWILGLSSAVSGHISKCVTCRRLRAANQGQRMADLPSDRLEPVPPFTYCAVDYFGPWYVKDKRTTLKRYGVMFTCMSSRAVHIEVANSLETDAFINALQRFLAIRGPIRQLRCDRGTNFVGAENDLKRALEEMNHEQISQFLFSKSCDYFTFKINVPSSSHMGGVWERQIRTIRSSF